MWKVQTQDKNKDTLKNLKNYREIKSEISIDQKLITHANLMRNISKSNLIRVMIYLKVKR